MLKAQKFSMNRVPMDSISAESYASHDVKLPIKDPARTKAICVPTFCRSPQEAQNQGKTHTAARYKEKAFGYRPPLLAKIRTKTRHRQGATPQNDTRPRLDALPWCADTFVLVSQNAHAHGSNVSGIGCSRSNWGGLSARVI